MATKKRKVYAIREVSTTSDGVRIELDIAPGRPLRHVVYMRWDSAADLIRRLRNQAKYAREAAQRVEEA